MKKLMCNLGQQNITNITSDEEQSTQHNTYA